MSERPKLARPPLVLIASDQEWSTRSLESILWPNGYAVLRAYTGRKALERARSAQPDLVILDSSLPDVDSLELCREFREEGLVTDSTPILMTAPVRPSRPQRLAALRAGAWEFVSYPLDAEELMLRLDGFTRAKFDADHVREDALLDPNTGLYNLRGLERRAREIGAHAFRNDSPMACVVVAPVHRDGLTPSKAIDLSAILTRVLRVSDAIGQLGETEFAILAPGTDGPGAIRIAERLAEAINQTEGVLGIRVGYEAIRSYRETPLALTEMLARATSALKSTADPTHPDAADPGRVWVNAFSADQLN